MNVVSHNRKVISINHLKVPKQHISVIPWQVLCICEYMQLAVHVRTYGRMHAQCFLFCLHVLVWVQDRDVCLSASPVSRVASMPVGRFRHSTSRNIQNSPLSSWTASGCPAHGWRDLGDFVFPVGPERQDELAVVNILPLRYVAYFSLLFVKKKETYLSLHSPRKQACSSDTWEENKTHSYSDLLKNIMADFCISNVFVHVRVLVKEAKSVENEGMSFLGPQLQTTRSHWVSSCAVWSPGV